MVFPTNSMSGARKVLSSERMGDLVDPVAANNDILGGRPWTVKR